MERGRTKPRPARPGRHDEPARLHEARRTMRQRPAPGMVGGRMTGEDARGRILAAQSWFAWEAFREELKAESERQTASGEEELRKARGAPTH